ncbi:MAG: hypothetical protein FWB76_00280 [Oscillospiraceae bacterium]|nr:hypothetical protein [Oscillospiraceae bacterium]
MATQNQTSTLWELPPMPEQPAKKSRGNTKKLLIAIIAVVAAVAVALTVVLVVLGNRVTPTERVIRNYFAAIESRDTDAMFNLSAFGAIPYDDIAQPMREPFAQYMRDGLLDLWGVVGSTSHSVGEPTFFAANLAGLPANLAESARELAELSIVAEEFAHMSVTYTIYATAAAYENTGFFTMVRVGGNWYLMLDPYFFRGQ